MPSDTSDVVIIGGGIVGLGIGVGLLRRAPSLRVTVFEAETQLAMHGSGRNSGVLHAGFYYSPDSLKARLTRVGNEMLRQLCRDEGVTVRSCGKVVVTRNSDDVARLQELHSRALANGVSVELLDVKDLRRIEPLATTHDVALWSPNTAVANPTEVTEALARTFHRLGGEIRYSSPVCQLDEGAVTLVGGARIGARHFINAAGLYADKIAHSAGAGGDYEMLPFKGLYVYGGPNAPALQRHVYPVPDPRNPFLGVHLTVTVDGRVKVGPTAIPALSRTNYTKLGGIKASELGSIARLLPKFLVSKHHNGLGLIKSEVPKYVRQILIKQAAALVPSVRPADFVDWGKSGIRAQLFNLKESRLEMDFVVESIGNHTHVLNAVSPAWTSSLSFGDHVAQGVVAKL